MDGNSAEVLEKPVQRITESREFARTSRRELFKLSPVLAFGAVLVPKIRDSILRAGMNLSDGAAQASFRGQHLAETFANHEVAPLERFPFNYYDVLDLEVDLDTWSLTVSGIVKRPGEYKLAQIQALPKVVQNTHHVCIEGWSVIGNFGARGSPMF